jgi:uncharacterized damage-inducible protein DinB
VPTPQELRIAGRRLSAQDFAGTIRSFYPYWDAQYRPFLVKAVEAFPADRLDFKPHPSMMTARQMILHIPEAERGWIHHVVEGGNDEEWVAPHADPAQGWTIVASGPGGGAPDTPRLLALMEEWHRPTRRWLDRPAGELSRVLSWTAPNGERRVATLHWILDHLQEHEIHHRAQLNSYLRLIGVEPPSI